MTAFYLLLIFMIIGAVVAIEVKDLLSSVIAVGTVGLALSITFLLLQAPDVAITQLVVEIFAVVILIRATLRPGLPESPQASRKSGALVALLFSAVIVAVASIAFRELPAFGTPIMRVARTYLEDGVADTGSVNLVTSVVLDYRAYDTLGEVTILLTAVVGVLAIVRKVGRKEPEEG